MSRYRNHLPRLAGSPFLTDGGLETTLIFHEGVDLPYFAAFVLLNDDAGRSALSKYFDSYLQLAQAHKSGFIYESPTWRASRDWGEKLGYSPEALAEANRRSIEFGETLRRDYQTQDTPVVLSGCIGPGRDGYVPSAVMSEAEAEDYHREQIGVFSQSNADLVTALTMNTAEEAIGVARAAQSLEMPEVVSFTVETDGKLPSGETLQSALERVDAATGGYPAHYRINCAHPTHFEGVLSPGAPWVQRIGGLRANASRLSHAELDEAEELDEGNPVELGAQHQALLQTHGRINVLGRCCGTDHRHVAEIGRACLEA